MLTVVAACGSEPTAPSSPTPASTATASPSPASACVEQVLGRMSVAQRVGQLFSLGLAHDQFGQTEADAIRALHVGSVWFAETSTAGAGPMRAVSDAVQSQASEAATGGARFFVAANQEGGQVQALRGPGFSQIPAAVVQGALAPASLQGSAAGWGQELKTAGVNQDFAPVLDVVPPGTDAQNQPIGVLQREYGHDPATAGSHGAAFHRGMQQAGIATTLKHFPGLGRVQGNTDVTGGVVDRTTTLDDASLQSFRQGIAAGAPFVMVSLATYTRIDPDHLAVFSPAVMRQMLRVSLGFTGVVVSDDLGAAAAVAGIPPAQRAVDFLTSGGDMVVSKTFDTTVAMLAAVRSRAASDADFRATVDAAARRVLVAKQTYGLLPCSG